MRALTLGIFSLSPPRPPLFFFTQKWVKDVHVYQEFELFLYIQRAFTAPFTLPL